MSMRTRRHEQREKALELLGNKCTRCGSKKRLEFDHIIPSSKNFILAVYWGCKWEKLLPEIEKCQLLCKSCHVKKSVSERGWLPAAHGTLGMYHNYRCRCQPCRDSNTKQVQAWRAKRRLEKNLV